MSIGPWGDLRREFEEPLRLIAEWLSVHIWVLYAFSVAFVAFLFLAILGVIR